ncbi:hypothetical protein HY065_01225 [Candidatus Berkelbacteria bacterium]|nr:hypothetical protein [Candidatus Berkelbacteria bacterium]
MAQQKNPLVLGAILVIAVIAAAVLLKNKNESPVSSTSPSGKSTASYSLTKSGYQALVLSNDQVYVGKISNLGDQFVKVDEAYLLIASESTSDKGKTDLKLIKLEEGVHGPTNAMLVNRDHIALVEDLRSDSKLLDIIKNYQGPKK